MTRVLTVIRFGLMWRIHRCRYAAPAAAAAVVRKNPSDYGTISSSQSSREKGGQA